MMRYCGLGAVGKVIRAPPGRWGAIGVALLTKSVLAQGRQKTFIGLDAMDDFL
ncbi:MAG: hypothetical protein ACLSFZ_01790 [Frisingicoccus sp.]